MSATTSVNLSPHTLLALLEYLRDTGATTDPAEAVDIAVRHWLAAMKQGTGDNAPAAPRGYQWKSLFLPDGTWLRMAYRGDHEYAHVEGDRLMYKGRPSTPNKFASDHTKHRAQRLARHLDATVPRTGGSVIPLPPMMQRDVEPGPRWTEPERRKFRYRLEDVAFD